MTSRSPPLSRIIPIFLWLKVKEIGYVAALTLLVILGIVNFFLISALIGYSTEQDSCEGLRFSQSLTDNACVFDITFTGGFVLLVGTFFILMIGKFIWMCASLIADWLRSNWQQATKIAKAREKGR